MQRPLKPRNPKLENVQIEELINIRIVRKLVASGFISLLRRTHGLSERS